MATDANLETLIAALDDAVNRGLEYFEGPGTQSTARVEDWGPREVLCHMVVWHQSTVEGMESVLSGGPPIRLTAPTDEMNAGAVEDCRGREAAQIAAKIRDLQARMAAAARALPDPGATVLVRSSGAEASARQRLELIAGHWNEHLKELGA